MNLNHRIRQHWPIQLILASGLCLAPLGVMTPALAYVVGTAQPSSPVQTQINSAYSQWKSTYLRTDPQAANRQYVWFGNKTGTQVVSEGQGFGMLAVMQMSDGDNSAKTTFDALYRYYRAHPSINSPALMAWSQALINNQLVDNDGADSATDGDFDAAYALLLAADKWGNAGEIKYLDEAIKTINALMSKTVNQSEWTIKLGDWAQDSDAKYGTSTRGSDFMFDHLRAFYLATGDIRWKNVLDKTYAIADSVYRGYAPNTGLLPDFIIKQNNVYQPAPPKYLEADTDGKYSWNNCRVPWRISIDYLVNGETRALPLLQTLNTWISTAATAGDPGRIVSGYELNGKALNSDTSMAFIAPFAVSAAISKNNQVWLDSLWQRIASAPAEGYYADSIRLLSMIAAGGAWKHPGVSTSTPTPNPTTTPTASPTAQPSITPTLTPKPTPTLTPKPTPTLTPKPTANPTIQPSSAPSPNTCSSWFEGGSYTTNQCITYKDKQYRALVNHTAYAGTNWNPADTPSLWTLK